MATKYINGDLDVSGSITSNYIEEVITQDQLDEMIDDGYSMKYFSQSFQALLQNYDSDMTNYVIVVTDNYNNVKSKYLYDSSRYDYIEDDHYERFFHFKCIFSILAYDGQKFDYVNYKLYSRDAFYIAINVYYDDNTSKTYNYVDMLYQTEGTGVPYQLKTINNNSLIGTGNIDIQGGGGTSILYRHNILVTWDNIDYWHINLICPDNTIINNWTKFRQFIKNNCKSGEIVSGGQTLPGGYTGVFPSNTYKADISGQGWEVYVLDSDDYLQVKPHNGETLGNNYSINTVFEGIVIYFSDQDFDGENDLYFGAYSSAYKQNNYRAIYSGSYDSNSDTIEITDNVAPIFNINS